MLYDLIQCPHRVTLDVHGDPNDKDDVSVFVELLWKKGMLHEKKLIEALTLPFLDLSDVEPNEREPLTLQAMNDGVELIYSGQISVNGMKGIPDLLRKEGNGYIAGDIKSGAGLEGDEDTGKPKVHYGVQLALYTDVLENIKFSAGRHAFIWDRDGEEVPYNLEEKLSVRTPDSLWDKYQEAHQIASRILTDPNNTLPAKCSACKLCHWNSHCSKKLIENDDLSLIPELGRSKRDVMMGSISTVAQLATADISNYIVGRKTQFEGISPASLEKFQSRAQLLTASNAEPYIKHAIHIPQHNTELFFDIEVDPFNDVCYLHGFVVRKDGDTSSEKYIAFYSDDLSEENEKRVFAEAYQFIQDQQPCSLYYYSHYEHTWWKKLQERYPDVCSLEDIQSIFESESAVDLYTTVVRSSMEWPTYDYSIKTLARYLGFHWRDTDPSGASSIEWFHQYLETGSMEIKNRILEYNEDDCIATRVLLDGIQQIMNKETTF